MNPLTWQREHQVALGRTSCWVHLQRHSPHDIAVLAYGWTWPSMGPLGGALWGWRDLCTAAVAQLDQESICHNLFATGLGALGLFGWRRKRRVTAVSMSAAKQLSPLTS